MTSLMLSHKISEVQPIFRARLRCLVKEKNPLNLHIFSQKGKSMAKLGQIQNTSVSTSVS